MRFTETPLSGAYVIEPEPFCDERGFFARTFCQREFERHDLNPNVVQCNIAYNKLKGTLRGMHYQMAPHAEVKLVRCTSGAIFDVIIDLRLESQTFKQWFGAELNAQNRKILYVPEGFAHGYQTLDPRSEIFYMVSQFYTPGSERGIRWNDPIFNIQWPIVDPIVSLKDSAHADFCENLNTFV